ncbi:Uncharacterised protein [Mycobacteroides abscessus]|nr:Uncharacterised protein [Mycobacteroides abscessus]
MLLDEQHGQPARVGEREDRVLDLRDDGRLDALGGLVEHEHARAGEEGARDGELLALPAGQEPGPPAEEPAQGGEQVERLVEAARPLARRVGDELEVLPRREVTERLLPLRHVRETAPYALVGREAGEVLAVEHDAPRPSLEQPERGAQERRLAGAVVPEHGGDATGGHGDVDAVEHHGPAVAGVQARELEHHASFSSVVVADDVGAAPRRRAPRVAPALPR